MYTRVPTRRCVDTWVSPDCCVGPKRTVPKSATLAVPAASSRTLAVFMSLHHRMVFGDTESELERRQHNHYSRHARSSYLCSS
jgi:hypothetical protein